MVDDIEKKSFRRLLWILVFLIVIILGLGGTALVLKLIEDNEQIQQEESKKIETVVLEGSATMDDLAQYIKDIDKQIEAAETNEEKAKLYSMRAGYLTNYLGFLNDKEQFLKQIKSDIYKAEELSPDANTAIEIVYYEEAYGDKEQAEYYLQKSDERGGIHGGG